MAAVARNKHSVPHLKIIFDRYSLSIVDYLDVGHPPADLVNVASSICAWCVGEFGQPAVLPCKQTSEKIKNDQEKAVPGTHPL